MKIMPLLKALYGSLSVLIEAWVVTIAAMRSGEIPHPLSVEELLEPDYAPTYFTTLEDRVPVLAGTAPNS